MPEDIVKYSGKTKVIYHMMSEEEKKEELARLREKALHDEASALSTARKEGRAEGLAEEREAGRAEREQEMVKNMRMIGMSEEQITKILST